MAIKYVVLPEQKKVIAFLKNTKYDAYNKALKVCREMSEKSSKLYICPNPDEMLMPNEFRGVAVCKDGDTFDEEIGKSIARSICLNKYYKSFDKKMDKFDDDLINFNAKIVNYIS